MKQRSQDKIREDLLALRRRLREAHGPHCDLSVLQSVLQGKIDAKAIEEAANVYDAYSVRDLIAAAEMNAELDNMDATPSNGGEH